MNNQNTSIPAAFAALSDKDLTAVNGGVGTILTVAGGVVGAIGFINLGIRIGNKIFKNNAKEIFVN